MKKLLTYKECSEYLSITEGSLRNMVLKREIPFLKIGKRVRFDTEELSQWLSEKSVGPYQYN